jgi:methyl-accepting chemotaxis protein
MKTKRSPRKPPTDADLDQALRDLQDWTKRASIKAEIPKAEELDDVTGDLARQFAGLLRSHEASGIMQQIEPLLSILRRAKSIAGMEAASLVQSITAVFSQAVLDARSVSADAKRHRESLSNFADREMEEIKTAINAAREEIAAVVKDFKQRADDLESARCAARSIKTVLGEMRGHAKELRKVILRQIEKREYEAACENLKALFAFYDVNLSRRFDAPGEVMFGSNLVIDADDNIILNGVKLGVHGQI